MKLTVSKIKKMIEDLDDSMEISFGSSKYSSRPLVFYRFKKRGEDLLQIELNEVEYDVQGYQEQDNRITVGYLKEQLEGWNDSDEVTFGSTLDAKLLVLNKINVVTMFEFTQE